MRTWDHACINSRVEVHVRCVEGALGLGGHVVTDVVRLVARFHHACAITKCRVLSFWILQSNCALVVRLYSVIVNVICNQIVAHFHIAKTGHLRCCFYTPVGYSRPPSAVNDPSVTEEIEFLKAIFGGFRQSTVNNGSLRSFPKLCLLLP